MIRKKIAMENFQAVSCSYTDGRKVDGRKTACNYPNPYLARMKP